MYNIYALFTYAQPYKIISIREIWLLLDTTDCGTLLLFRQTLYVPSAPGVWRHLAEHRPNRNINSKPTRHVDVNAHHRLLKFLLDSRDKHIV